MLPDTCKEQMRAKQRHASGSCRSQSAKAVCTIISKWSGRAGLQFPAPALGSPSRQHATRHKPLGSAAHRGAGGTWDLKGGRAPRPTHLSAARAAAHAQSRWSRAGVRSPLPPSGSARVPSSPRPQILKWPDPGFRPGLPRPSHDLRDWELGGASRDPLAGDG